MSEEKKNHLINHLPHQQKKEGTANLFSTLSSNAPIFTPLIGKDLHSSVIRNQTFSFRYRSFERCLCTVGSRHQREAPRPQCPAEGSAPLLGRCSDTEQQPAPGRPEEQRYLPISSLKCMASPGPYALGGQVPLWPKPTQCLTHAR